MVKREVDGGFVRAADEEALDDIVAFIQEANTAARSLYGYGTFVVAIATPETNVVVAEPATFYSTLIAAAALATNAEAPALVLGVAPDGTHTAPLLVFGQPDDLAIFWLLRNVEWADQFLTGVLDSIAVNAAMLAAKTALAETTMKTEH